MQNKYEKELEDILKNIPKDELGEYKAILKMNVDFKCEYKTTNVVMIGETDNDN